MNDGFWLRARAYESRHDVAPGCTVPGETVQDRIREGFARDAARKAEDKLIAWTNQRLVDRGLVLARHDIYANPSLGLFVLKKLSDGSIVVGNINPRKLAASLQDTAVHFA